MRDQHDRMRIVTQVAFEPVARIQVQVVRGLVQQQQARLLEQELCERDSHLPAAAELLARTPPIAPGKPQAIQHGSDFRLQGISAVQSKLLRQRSIALELPVVFGAGLLHLRQFVLQLAALQFESAQVFKHRERFVEQGPAARNKAILRQVAKSQVAGAHDLAFIRLDQPRKHLHQGALAGAVLADQADAVPLIDLELERAEEPFPAICLSQFLSLEHLIPRNGEF